MSDSDREAFEKHCPMPKGLVFNASLNRYDGGVYTSALSYNDMWCAWQHAWQAALQHSGEAVAWLCDAGDGVNVNATCSLAALADYKRFGRKITPLYTTPQPVVPVEWINRLDEALDLTYRADIRPARSCILQLRKALLSAGKENNNAV
jgi:hypothetical protein